MKLFIVLAFVALFAVATADDDCDDSYSSYSAPSYSAPSYSAPSYSAPTYTKTVVVHPPPHYETVHYAGYTRAGKKGKKIVPVYKTVSKY